MPHPSQAPHAAPDQQNELIRAQIDREMPYPPNGFETDEQEQDWRNAHEARFLELVSVGPPDPCPVEAQEPLAPNPELPLNHPAWNEYDGAAKQLAQEGKTGAVGCPLPANMTPEAVALINYDPEAFEQRVRDFARALHPLASEPEPPAKAQPAGLLAMFQRYDELVVLEPKPMLPGWQARFDEWSRLRLDIPEHIRRLVAFAEIGTDAIMAKAQKKPVTVILDAARAMPEARP